MEKEDALKIMMLKAEQQVNTIEFLNKQLEVTNGEKQELRMQLLALSNDNLILRREKDSLSFQIQKYQNQIEHLQQGLVHKSNVADVKDNLQKQQNTSDSLNNNQKLTPAYLFLQQEYQKTLEDNSQQRTLLQELKNSLQSQQLLIQSIKFDNEKQKTEIKHYQDIIKSKEKHLVRLEQQLKSQQEEYQEKIDVLSTKLLLQKATLLQQPQLQLENHSESTLIQQYKEKYEMIKQEHEKLLQQLNNQNEPQISVERAINEMQLQSSDRNQAQSLGNQFSQMKYSNDQTQQSQYNTFQLKTVTSYPSLASQPKVSDRLKNSDYS